MAYTQTECPTFKVAAAIPMFALVSVTTTAGQVEVATGASTKIIGTAQNETFAADEKVSVLLLLGGTTRPAIASGAIAVGDFVEAAAAGEVTTVAGPTNLVALTAAADNEYVTICHCAAKIGQ